MKEISGDLKREAPFVIDSGWVTAEERMNEDYLKYVIAEKEYGVRLAEEALSNIIKGESILKENNYYLAKELFRRTLITARIHKAAASSYFAYRIYNRGPEFRTKWLKETLSASLNDLLTSASEIENYTESVPRGQWNWKGDAAVARKYHKLITETGWPEYNNTEVNPSDIQQIPEIAGKSWKSVAISMPSAWYGTYESLRVAENVLLYQRNAGGWPKNTEMHRVLTDEEKAAIEKDKTLGDAIFDNSATTTEMKFLARMYNSTRREDFRLSFNRGLRFILDAQYDNGGWPMFYPLRKGYYTHITFNDNAIVNILGMLRDIDSGSKLYAGITDPSLMPRIEKAISSGISCILRTQIIVNGKPTVWCAQHDENTFLPAKARSYELPSFSGAESVGIILFLMDIEKPSMEIIRAVEGAVTWFNNHRLTDTRIESFTNSDGLKDKRLITDPEAGDMWARFYDLDTGEPFVCDRDGIKKKSLDQIGYERRNGYTWYTDDPEKIFTRYPEWKKQSKTTGTETEK
jgi:pectinesterase